MSSVATVPVSYFVYSALSCFGPGAGGELPGAWFVRALSEAGRSEAAVRQTLYRMERDGELIARRAGRVKFYAPSSYARAEIAAGTAKIFGAPAARWDGRWTVVRVGLRTSALATDRERVLALLAVEGYARLDANVFVHPRADAVRVVEALPARARGEVVAVRGVVLGADAVSALVRLWRIDRLAQRYRRLLQRLRALERAVRAGPSDAASFMMRFAVVFEYLGVAWDDPGLPDDVLPPDWPAAEARALAARLYERLLPASRRHAQQLLQEAIGSHRFMTR